MNTSSPGPGTGPQTPGTGPRSSADGDDMDVVTLAGQPPGADGEWLVITAADEPGGEFTAARKTPDTLEAWNGDVVVRVLPDPSPADAGTVRAEVWAVLDGRLALAGRWDQHDAYTWPGAVLPTIAFAMRMVTELEDHDVPLGGRYPVDLAAAAATGPGTPPAQARLPG